MAIFNALLLVGQLSLVRADGGVFGTFGYEQASRSSRMLE